MGKNIPVKESIRDKDSEYNIKRFKFGHIDVERPIKVLDAGSGKINKKIFEGQKKNFENVIFESSKFLKPDSIKKVLEESDDSTIKKRMGLREWITEYPYTITHTFDFNPYDYFKNLEKIAGYFYYYYQFSDTILLVPNIKLEKEGKQIISIEEYLRYIEEAYSILNRKNHKKIFVPLSLRFGMNDIENLARKYEKNDFFNIWIDFEGSSVGSRTKIARIRRFFSVFDELEKVDDIITYSTNMRREITSNTKSNESPSSDVLTSVIGANIIGVNREPQGFGEKIDKNLPEEEIQKIKEKRKKKMEEMKKHKARYFDPESYYYYKIINSKLKQEEKNRLMNMQQNIVNNSFLLDNEFNSQAEHFLEKGDYSIKKYICDKSMIKEYKKGYLIDDLFGEKSKKKLNWF